MGEQARNADGFNGAIYFCVSDSKITLIDGRGEDDGRTDKLTLIKSGNNMDNIRAVVDMSRGTLAFYQGETVIFKEYQNDSFKTGFPVLE